MQVATNSLLGMPFVVHILHLATKSFETHRCWMIARTIYTIELKFNYRGFEVAWQSCWLRMSRISVNSFTYYCDSSGIRSTCTNNQPEKIVKQPQNLCISRIFSVYQLANVEDWAHLDVVTTMQCGTVYIFVYSIAMFSTLTPVLATNMWSYIISSYKEK